MVSLSWLLRCSVLLTDPCHSEQFLAFWDSNLEAYLVPSLESAMSPKVAVPSSKDVIYIHGMDKQVLARWC